MSQLIFDKYEIQHRLAVGGMGEVFYAVQTGAVKGFERPAILKNLLPDLAQQDGFVEQFLDEARVAATLNHPNVVSIYEVGLWNGTYFIAMEYIRGRNLSQLIKLSLKNKLPIPPAVVARVVHDAALGLEHAHAARDAQGNLLHLVHRDISPQNIMVRHDGVTKVVDFGIARAANRASRTATGAVKGKLAYMAPEQVLSRDVTGQADQFALGVVLWELCTRRRLFQSERDVDLIKLVLEAPIPKPSSFVAGLPEELDEIAMRMMQRDASQRYANLGEVARELQTFLVKFSKPSNESPVSAYMRQLGTEDLDILPPRSTPSGQNFVISLKGTPPPEHRAVASPPKPMVVPPTSTMERPPPRRSRAGLAVVVGLLVIAVGAGVAYVRSIPPPVEHAVVAPPVQPQRVEAPPAVVEPPRPVEPVAPPAPKAPGKLGITSTPSGAGVRVDGRKKGDTPLTLELPSGESVHLQVEKPGYAPVEQDVAPDPGAMKKIDLKLLALPRRPAPASAPPSAPAAPAVAVESGNGFLTVDTKPWSRVSVDGDPMGSTPVFKKPFPAGKHVVVMEAENGAKATRTVEIRPNEVMKLQLEVN